MTIPTCVFADPIPLRVLLVEDDAVNRILSSLVVQAVTGMDAEVVDSGEDALALLQRQAFDVVLMDLHLPGIDGVETTRRIRALPSPMCLCTVLALTASDTPQDVQRCQAAGMAAHLVKPIDSQTLRQALSVLPRGAANTPG